MAETTELIGRIFDSRYQITEQIGRGGMGAVYKAIHVAMNQVVALKVLGREMSADDKQVQRFYQEARSSSRLKHPNTIKVFDFGRAEEGQLYLAMEFLEGQTLTQLLRQETVLPVDRTIKIAKQIAKSLAEAHMNGLVHRDLKPDNVFITRIYGEEDFVKVLDFGIAKFLEGNPEHERLTQAGLVCGTPLYISPEQALGRSLDGRSDLYSLGVILYEMLSGSPPFRADTPVALVMRHIHDSPPDLKEINPGLALPRALHELIFNLLDKDRDKRPSTAEELLQALDSVLAGGVPASVSARPPAVPPPIAGKPGGNTRVETPEGGETPVGESAGPEDETQMLPQAGGRVLGGGQTDEADLSEETIVLPSALDDDGPVEIPAEPAPRPVEPRPRPAPPSGTQGRQPIWPWLLFGLVSLAIGGGMAAYGLGFFEGAPQAGKEVEAKTVAAAPVVPKKAEPAPPAPAPEPVPPKPVPRTLDITLETVPAGADVEMDGKRVGKTPVYLTVREGGESRTVVFRSDGYRETTVLLDQTAAVVTGKTLHRYFLEAVPEPVKASTPKKKIVRKKTVRKKTVKKKTVKKKPRPKATRPKAKPEPKPVLNWE